MTQLPILLQRGYCVKSPPQELMKQRRWHKRWCTLSIEEIQDVDKFYKKQNKGKEKGVKATVQKPKYLILSYFKDQAEEEKHKSPIKQFILDDSQVADEPGGQHGIKFAIRIQLSADHNNRLMYLCFDTTEEHQIWLSHLNGYFERNNRKDSFQVEHITAPSLKFKPTTDNPMQKALFEFRKTISQKREEKARSSFMEDVFEEYNAGANYGKDLPLYTEIDSVESKLDEEYSGTSENDKCFDHVNVEPGNTDSGVFVE